MPRPRPLLSFAGSASIPLVAGSLCKRLTSVALGLALAGLALGPCALAQPVTRVHAKNYFAEYYDQGYFLDTERNNPVSGRVIGHAPDGVALRYKLKRPPENGTAVVASDGTVSYTPATGFAGLDSLLVEVAGSSGETAEAVVRISVGPSAPEYVAALAARFPERTHPRLLFTEEELTARFEAAKTDAFLARTLRNIVAEAGRVLKTEPETTFSQGPYRGLIERRYLNLAFAFKYTRDARYLKRLVRELRASCDPAIFPHWGEADKGGEITSGQILCATAIAYDLVYQYLDADTRTLIERAVVRNAYAPALKQLMANEGIYGRFNNYNGIGSSGLAFSAMAFIDADFGGDAAARELTQKILPKALRALQRSMVSFQPDGAYYEGLAYGLWTLRHLALPCIAAEKVFGLPPPAELTSAVYRSPEWFNAVRAGRGAFGSAEDKSVDEARTLPVSVFFATKAGRPDYAWPHRNAIAESGGDWQDFIYYDADTWARAASAKPQITDVYLRGYEMAILRSDFGNPMENAVSLYNGTNVEWHAALEAGTIQLTALGTAWFISLGGDEYSIPGYGKKSNVYRKRAEGRNTLVLNPRNGPDQLWSRGKIDRFERSSGDAFAIADLTGACANSAERVTRGVRLFHGKSQFLVQDEIRSANTTEAYAFFHTGQALAIAADGRSATFTDSRGNRLLAQLLSPEGATLLSMPARMLPSSPTTAGQNPNAGIRKLAVHVRDAQRTTISLWLVPVASGQVEPAQENAPAHSPLADWKL